MGKPSLQDTLEFENDNDNDKYLIENLTTLGPLHSMLCKGIEFTSKNQFPVVEPYTGELPESLCSIHRLRKKPDSLLRILCAHFFTDDSNIEPYWNNPFKYLRFLQRLGWDGDLLRELLDRETVSKYDWQQHTIVDLHRFDGQFNNGTKSNPCLQADLLGDWREEVLCRDRESTELRLYTTTIPTDYRLNCLMHDIPYRLSVATQNVAYNQPPEPGYYIGPDRTDYLK